MRFINFLIKPASSACNLKCRYCFYEDEANKRFQKSFGKMANATVDALLRRAYEASEEGGSVSFAFQGGEPTLAGLDFYRNFVQKAKSEKPQGVSLLFSIQTNGILLDEEWADFFRREHFLVGLSLDGNEELHNANRIDPQGNGTYERVKKAYELLTSFGVEVNILAVVTSFLAEHGKEAYDTIKKMGCRYIQFIACLDPMGEKRGGRPYSLTPDAYGKFLCTLFDLYYADWKKGDFHSIRLFDDDIHILLNDGVTSCATCGRCGGYFVVEADGSVYPCDFHVIDKWRGGDIFSSSLEEIVSSQAFVSFLQKSQKKPDECLSCRYRKLCNGGCQNDWQDGHNYYCSSFRMFFDYAADRILEIARAEWWARR